MKWYIEHKPETFKKAIYKDPRSGEWRLTIEEKKRILTTHIFGVDIDSQAVEVTKLSLLLKVLEGETDQSLSQGLLTFGDRALPNLSNNIKCGNSLIGPDYFTGKMFPDPEEMKRVNAFDWKQGFPDAMKAGGFDCVIGNPPYVRQESLSNIKEYLERNYEAFESAADLYAYFMERSVKMLRDDGRSSFIVSSSFLRTTYAQALRRVLKEHVAVLSVVDFGGLAVFENAKDTYVCIPLFAKTSQPVRVEVSQLSSLKFQSIDANATANRFTIPQELLSANAWELKSDEEAAVFAKLVKLGQPLGDYVKAKIYYGVKTGLNEAFVIDRPMRDRLADEDPNGAELIKPFLGGEEIRRYLIENDGRHLIVIPSGWTRQEMAKTGKRAEHISERAAWTWFSAEHPIIAAHLEPFQEALRKRQDQGDYWWELRPCSYYKYFDRPKIIFPDICKGPRFFLDRSGIYLANTAYCLGVDDPYLLGVLNSRLFWFAISNISIPFGIRAGKYRYRLIYQYMEKVPIRAIDVSNKSDKAAHDRMVMLVDSMLGLHKQLAAAKSEGQKGILQRQIDATDADIDRLVYDLYGLTDEEIAIVEGAQPASAELV